MDLVVTKIGFAGEAKLTARRTALSQVGQEKKNWVAETGQESDAVLSWASSSDSGLGKIVQKNKSDLTYIWTSIKA
jgi:hypothetical protein